MRSEQLAVITTLAVLFALTQTGFSQQQPTTAAPALDIIVSRMQQAQEANRERARAYTITRDYRFFDAKESSPKSEVIADISFVPPDRKTFTIEKTDGSDRGQSIVKHILESEAEAAKKDSPIAVDPSNYNFSLLGGETVDGRPCWVLKLKPKHDRKDLIDGKAWVDRDTYLIHRVEGDMAKSPSWWLKRVHITVDFADLGGMWMQKGTRAVAEVRFFGPHIFTSDAVKIRTAEEVARVTPPNFLAPQALSAALPVVPRSPTAAKAVRARSRPSRPVPPVLGAGILVR